MIEVRRVGSKVNDLVITGYLLVPYSSRPATNALSAPEVPGSSSNRWTIVHLSPSSSEHLTALAVMQYFAAGC